MNMDTVINGVIIEEQILGPINQENHQTTGIEPITILEVKNDDKNITTTKNNNTGASTGLPGKKKPKTRVLLSDHMKMSVIRCFQELAVIMPGKVSKRQIEIKVADIFSISRAQVFRIMDDHAKGRALKSATTGKRKKSKFFLDPEFQRKLLEYIERFNQIKMTYTVADLENYAKKELAYTGGRSTFYRILKSMDYSFKKTQGRYNLAAKPKVKKQKFNEITAPLVQTSQIIENATATTT